MEDKDGFKELVKTDEEKITDRTLKFWLGIPMILGGATAVISLIVWIFTQNPTAMHLFATGVILYFVFGYGVNKLFKDE